MVSSKTRRWTKMQERLLANHVELKYVNTPTWVALQTFRAPWRVCWLFAGRGHFF